MRNKSTPRSRAIWQNTSNQNAFSSRAIFPGTQWVKFKRKIYAKYTRRRLRGPNVRRALNVEAVTYETQNVWLADQLRNARCAHRVPSFVELRPVRLSFLSAARGR